MLKALDSLHLGLESGNSFQSFLTNQRILNLSLSSHIQLERFHVSGINALDIDRNEERFLLSGSKDGALCIHDLQNSTGKAIYTPKIVSGIPRQSHFSHKYSISCVQWYPVDTGIFVSSGMDSKLKIWDTNRMKPAEIFNLQHKIHSHHMSSVATHHSLIAVALEYPHTILLDPRTGSFCQELRSHNRSVPCLQWSPMCEFLIATGGVDSKIFLWDIRSAKGYLKALDQHNIGEARGRNRNLVTAHDGAINGLRFTDDGLHLASSGTDYRIRLWDVALGTNTLVNYGLVVNNSQYRNRSLEICSNSSPPVLFVPSSNYIFVFDLFSGERINTLVGHFSSVNCCQYLSTTNQLISGGSDLNILLWTPDKDKEVAEDNEKKRGGAVEPESLTQNSDEWTSEEES